jgi:hypothetical protein
MPPMHAAVLLALLAFVGPPVEDPAYVAAVAQLDDAIAAARREPSEAVAKLGPALEVMADFAPQLAFTPSDLERRAVGQLALAASHLALGDEAAASVVVDEAVRTAQAGEPLPVAAFGPQLAKLVQSRERALRELGSAELEITCHVPCRVFINEHGSSELTRVLLLGRYRVWIEARDGGLEPLRTTVELEARGQTVELVYGEPSGEPVETPIETPIEAPIEPPEDDVTPTPKRRRLLPRWAEATALGAGAALAVAGGVLLSYQGKCPGGFDPMVDFDDCPKVYDAKPAGFGLLGAGLGLAAIGGVMLTVDEVRVARDRRAQQAMLWWRVQF